MRDFNEFTFSGRVGNIDTSRKEYIRVSVYAHDDYQDKDGDWVDRSYSFSVAYYQPGMISFIENRVAVGDWVLVTCKVSVGAKDKGYPIYFNGIALLKPPLSGNGKSRSQEEEVDERPTKQQRKPARVAKKDAATSLDDFDDLFA